jgi:hypothetical protein
MTININSFSQEIYRKKQYTLDKIKILGCIIVIFFFQFAMHMK